MDAGALAEHVRRHYGVVGTIDRIPSGRAANFVVSDGSQRWLLKLFQEEYAHTRIEQAAEFVHFVVTAGYPAREFVPSKDGPAVLKCEGRAAVLIPWIEGDTPEFNGVSTEDALQQIGMLCGWLHRLGAQYPGASTLDFAGSMQSVAERQAALLRVTADPTCSAEIVAEIDARIAILAALGDELQGNYRLAPRGVIHGDFYGSHVVFRTGRAVGAIDVLGDNYLPGWELMRAFFQSVPVIDLSPASLKPRWRAYLSGYAGQYSIAASDVAIAFDTYLLQLAGSTYGLRQPLDDRLRAFGRWRTRLAQRLADHRQELRDLMASQTVVP